MANKDEPNRLAADLSDDAPRLGLRGQKYRAPMSPALRRGPARERDDRRLFSRAKYFWFTWSLLGIERLKTDAAVLGAKVLDRPSMQAVACRHVPWRLASVQHQKRLSPLHHKDLLDPAALQNIF